MGRNERIHIKKLNIILLILLSLLMIGSVSAADTNETVIGDDIEAEHTVELTKEPPVAEPKPIEKPTVTEPTGDFSKLDDDIVAAQINHNGTLKLEGDYQNAGDEDGITIKARKDEDGVYHKNLTIEGNHHTIDAQYKSNIFTIDEGMDFVIIQNLNFINAYTDDSEGGAIFTNAPLQLINVTFIDNTALHGGAIYNNDTGILDMENVIFINNTANGDEASGGAIFTTGAFADAIEKAIFINNTADYGGAIYSEDGYVLAMDIAIFDGNEALYGGAIFTKEDTNTTLTNVTFEDNVATIAGGAIYNNGITQIADSYFDGNEIYSENFESESILSGGAIVTGEKSILVIINTTFEDNNIGSEDEDAVSSVYGGAIDIQKDALVFIANSTFVYNNAFTDADGLVSLASGGAININEDAIVFIANSTFADNGAYANGANLAKAAFGGAIANAGKLFIFNSDFKENEVYAEGAVAEAAFGGAIANMGELVIDNSNFKENEAGDSDAEAKFSFGGAIFNSGKMSFTNSNFTNDVADVGLEIGNVNKNPDEVIFENITITNTKDYRDNLVVTIDDFWNEEKGTVYYNTIVNIDPMELNNVEGKVVFFFPFIDDEGEPTTIEGATVNIYIDGELVESGVRTDMPYTISKLGEGNYTLKVKFLGSEGYLEGQPVGGYAPFETTYELTVTKNATELQKELDNLQDKYDNLTTEYGILNDTNKNLTAENTKLKGDLANKTTEAANLQNQVNTLTSQLTTAQNANTEANAKIKKVKAPKKVKKSKKLKIKVTLSKKINGKYVYVIFNGKSYKAKAKNGVAKITIKSSTLNEIFNTKIYKVKTKKKANTKNTKKKSKHKKKGEKTVKYTVIYNQNIKNKTVKITK